jgi:hypothetical protein
MMQQSLIKRLQGIDPSRNIVFTAIEQLRNPEEIKRFYREYVEYLRTRGDEKVRETAKQVANENIGYVVVYYGEETSERWKSILEQINHPVFGRTNPFNNPVAENYFRGCMDAQNLMEERR